MSRSGEMVDIQVVLVYVTAPTADRARAIARMLVERRLAACVNILGTIGSLYYWQGELCEENEVALLAKTTREKLPELVEAVKAFHAYEVPAVVAIPAVGGNPDFLRWVGESVGE